VLINSAAGLTIHGAIIRDDVNPEEHVSYVINISIEENDQPSDFKAELLDFKQDLEGSIIIPHEGEDINPYSAAPFLSVSPTNMHIDPGGFQNIIVEGDIPADVGPGGRYAIVLVSGVDSEEESSVGSIAGAMIPILLTISNSELIQTCEIKEVGIDNYMAGGPLTVNLTAENTGNYHYKAKGMAELKDQEGNVIAKGESEVGGSIMPLYLRMYKIQIEPESELESGTYTLNAWVELEDGTVLASNESQVEI